MTETESTRQNTDLPEIILEDAARKRMTDSIASKPISEITEAEWQEMDDRLAREVMGFTWNPSYNQLYGESYWSGEIDRQHVAIEADEWHPHRDPAQMEMCWHKMGEDGWYTMAQAHWSIMERGKRWFGRSLWNAVAGSDRWGADDCKVGVLTMNRALDAEKENNVAE